MNNPAEPKQAIKWLCQCRRIHKDYANNPKWCRGNVGSVEHHKMWVKRYTEIIALLKLVDNA